MNKYKDFVMLEKNIEFHKMQEFQSIIASEYSAINYVNALFYMFFENIHLIFRFFHVEKIAKAFSKKCIEMIVE